MSKLATAILETVAGEQLMRLVSETPDVFDVSDGDDAYDVCFYFHDQDGDRLRIVVSIIDDQRVSALAVMVLPDDDDNLIATLAAVNEWNGTARAHGTFSYALTTSGRTTAILQSDLLLAGGVHEAHVRAWLSNLVEQIDPWETVVLEKWKQVPSDTDLTNGSGHSVGGKLLELGMNVLPYLLGN